MHLCKQVLTFVGMEKYNNTAIQILEAAKNLFAENGYKAVSTRRIAKEAKVNEVTIFRLFESKEKLFTETFDYFFFRPSFNLVAELKDISLNEFLLKLGEFLHEFFTTNLTLIKIEIRTQDGILKKGIINKFPQEVKSLVAAQFQKHKKMSKKQAEIEAVCFMTALHGLYLNLYVFKTLTGNVNFDECLKVIVSKFS